MLTITPKLGINAYKKTPDVETPGETKTPHEILSQSVMYCNQLTFSHTAHAPPSLPPLQNQPYA